MSAYTREGNKVKRGDEHVATIDGEEITMTEGNENYAGAVKRFINNEAETETEEKPKKTAKATVIEDDTKDFEESQRKEAARRQAIKARTYVGAPKMDPRWGDKTPEFMQWLEKNHPADYEIRYENRIVPHDREDAELGEKNALEHTKKV